MKNICKDKSKLNLSIDMVMLLLLLAVAGIGFLIKYVLIPGMQRNTIYGNNTDLEFWGLTRHEWGTIHLIISLVFLGLLILHIVLHWKMITCVYKRLIPHKTIRTAFAVSLTCIGFLLISFPLLIKPEVIQREPLHQNRENRNNYSQVLDTLNMDRNKQINKTNQNDSVKKHVQTLKEDYEVQGSMTLQYVADKYNVPVGIIASELKVPQNLADEKLGRLRRQYNFTMDDVRNIISKNRELK